MKLFLDTADVESIADSFETGLIDGVTTNPTLMMKSGRNPDDVYQELINLGVPDVSMEVVGDSYEMIQEGLRLAEKFKYQATIKVPCTPDGLIACRELSRNCIKVNVTLIFSPSQAILAAKAGATYVSPFVGRVDDNSFGGLCLIKDIANIYEKQNWKMTEILAASIRDVRSVGRAFEYGANICTLPPVVFRKMYKHILTDKGIELFENDWKSVQLSEGLDTIPKKVYTK